mmetsp:Transcript_40545/g.134175  ORF Transcript_40545/g.134175 Transcript_40545/m.134175 type:complete len:200 (+) Transcript_40545:264-863(+)
MHVREAEQRLALARMGEGLERDRVNVGIAPAVLCNPILRVDGPQEGPHLGPAPEGDARHKQVGVEVLVHVQLATIAKVAVAEALERCPRLGVGIKVPLDVAEHEAFAAHQLEDVLRWAALDEAVIVDSHHVLVPRQQLEQCDGVEATHCPIPRAAGAVLLDRRAVGGELPHARHVHPEQARRRCAQRLHGRRRYIARME